MRSARRIAFTAGIAALAAGTAGGTIAVGGGLGGSSAPHGAVAAVEGTIVSQPAAAAPASPAPNATARGAVLGFFAALRAGDYARACDQLLQSQGCEEGLAATNAGVTDYRLRAIDVAGRKARVDAVADGIDARFVLERRDTRWWISELVLDP